MGSVRASAFVRVAHVGLVGMLAGALIFSGASLANAEDAQPDATAAAGDTSSTAAASDSGTPTATEAPPAGDPAPPAPDPALPSAPDQVVTEPAPAEPAPAEPAPAEPAPVEPAPPAETPDAPAQPDATTQTTAPAVEVPALRWQVLDSTGAVVPGTTVTLEGPRNVEVEDLGADEQWTDAPTTPVVDNIGAADYVGLDLDPAPGVFRLEQFVDEETAKADPAALPVAVVAGSDYRVRAAVADGFVAGVDAAWTTLAVLTDAALPAQDVTVTAADPDAETDPEADPDAETDPNAKTDTDTGDELVTPMLVGPDVPGGAATPPYVYWTVKSGSTLMGGASFSIQGPATYSFFGGTRWNSNEATIVDNGPLDLDKDDGEFLVKTFDGHNISASNRYRIQQADAPSGYRFTQSASWVQVSGTRATPSANQWPNSTHDFGNFAVEKLPSNTPICQAGYTYAISDGGHLQQIVGSTRTNIGTNLSSSDMNGLGIGAGGANVYAIKRTGSTNSQTGTVYSFNTTTGVWTSTGNSQSTTVSLVAGAVNLSTGAYVFGGYSGDGSQFRMWKYTPGSGTFSYLGYITTSMGDGGNNGDMAFNAAGDLFIVHGRGTNVTVFSVTAANFNAANGGLIPSAKSATITTSSSDINGVAFDAAGKGYLGSSGSLTSYNMPNWSNASSAGTLNDSTDLASCSSPATIKLQKVVTGGRSSANDQFRLELKQGGTVLGTATTAGSATGVQPQVVGPLPVVRGATLTFSETFVNGASAANYATTYVCTVDGDSMGVAGDATSGSITIPNTGEEIVCEFVNTPLTASVSITKMVQDTNGENAAAASGWTVDEVPTATAGTVTRTPNSAQQTNGSGTATWPLKFGTAASRATVDVSETQQTGYEFVTGTCTITPMVGDPMDVPLTGADATPLTGIKPGDQVACTYTNRQLAGSISWQKITDDDPAVNIAGSVWSVQGPDAAGPTVSVDDCVGASPADCAAALDKDERAGFLTMTGLAWGEYTITETTAPEGFELDATPHTVTITAANASAGVSIDPVVNVRKLGSVSWTKVDSVSNDKLAGSEWTLTGPGFTPPNNTVIDCVSGACAGMLDQDPTPGAFLLEDLGWGDYTLVETKAPLGYVLDSTEHDFTIDKTTVSAVVVLGAIENTLAVAPSLPMTGGLGADFYTFLGLGALLLALVLLAIRKLWIRRNVIEVGTR